jgi:aminoglycoside phosphotransferase (APT) family kinase protein
VVDGEEELHGGRLSSAVVRIGDTVRRPAGPWTPAVHALLDQLHAAGFDGAPRAFGIDTEGREVVEHIPGEVPWPESHYRLLGTEDALRRVGNLLRRFHDAVAGFVPPAGATWRFPEMEADSDRWAGATPKVVCHNDPAAWNLVVGNDRWALIDWDTAGPRPPIWDVAYAAMGMVPITADPRQNGWAESPPVVARLRALAEGYGLGEEDVHRLPDVLVARIASSYAHMRRRAEAGVSPWDRLWRDGHGAAWAATLRFAEGRLEEWRAGLA